MQSTLRFARAIDTSDSYSAHNKFDAPAAAHSAPSPHTGAASALAASYPLAETHSLRPE